ncbi:alpha-L-arabinofuranosidase precursor [Pyrenophora seminiperda CCB06]|uniref:Alpha-L-arabinofuranosidase n=1 Tax=Pyrenophora seminiperda CCB06 TaxID=1302712 RepID=A0A3M7M3A9_9PLEO|nr:alpha-L-arabinofuranosidase precursor [Pyrenophora seminiperda CCB06]
MGLPRHCETPAKIYFPLIAERYLLPTNFKAFSFPYRNLSQISWFTQTRAPAHLQSQFHDANGLASISTMNLVHAGYTRAFVTKACLRAENADDG